MKILVANLGSTSFKYRLYDLGDPAEPLLARGSVERIGSDSAKVAFRSSKGEAEMVEPVLDHAVAVQLCLDQLTSPDIGVIAKADDVAAIGFKAVHARGLTGVHRVDEHVLDAMEAYSEVAPAHNPPYVKAMRMLHRAVPQAPARRGIRDRVPRDHPRALATLRRPRRVAHQARDQTLGVPRGEPPLHRGQDGRNPRARGR